MRSLMTCLTRWPRVLIGMGAAFGVALACAQNVPAPAASSAALAGPPAGFVAPAEPKSDETNAQRAKSQPGNNAPFWRAVRESGVNRGISTLPGTVMTKSAPP